MRKARSGQIAAELEPLFCGGDFVNDRLCCSAGIAGRDDWPANNNVIGAGLDGLCRSGGARLILLNLLGGFFVLTHPPPNAPKLPSPRVSAALRLLYSVT